MFHVELRRFPHVARAFNLSETDVQARIVLPWVKGIAITLEDRRWAPDRARLTIYESPEIAAEDRGLGRGWSSVTREGENVTARMIEAAGKLVPHASELKRRLIGQSRPVSLADAVALAGRSGRPSERLAVAEQAIWELLHEGRLALVRAGETEPVAQDEWETVLLRWASWADAGAALLVPRGSTR